MAKKLARDIPNSFYPNQYDNPMNPEAHYRTTGPEIWEDSEGKITHFVCGMGTGGTISGVGRYLKEKNPNVKIIGVDPIGSLYYDFRKTGKVGKAKTYVVEGIGEDIFPSTMNFKILDDVVQVNDQECFVWARRLVKQEGIFTGGSGGGCVSGALRVAKALPKGFRRGVSAGYGHALPEQSVQRRVDARARLRGFRSAAHGRGRGERQAQDGQGARSDVARPYQTVFHALHTMQTQDISQLPVFEEQSPIGAIYEDQILNLALQGKDLRKMVIREVMSDPLPTISCEAPVERLTYLLSHEEPAVFVQMVRRKFEIITKYDLMGTIAGLMEQKR